MVTVPVFLRMQSPEAASPSPAFGPAFSPEVTTALSAEAA